MKVRFLALAVMLCVLTGMMAGGAMAEEKAAEPIKYKAVVHSHTITKDMNEFEWLQEWEDEAGIDVEWECIYSDWDTLKSTMLASMDLPDFFFGGGALSLSDIRNNVDLFVKLNDYIDGSTNLKALYEKDPYLGQKTILEDGSIYSLTQRLPLRPQTGTGVYINQTWLDKLEKPMPTTLDELYDVLVAMKEGDPNGNGEADEFPWVGAAEAYGWLMGSFGVADSMYNLMLDDQGKAVYIYTTDAMKEAIKFMAKCYQAGLIDPEIFTQDWSVYYAAAQQETEVVGLCEAWTISAICGTVNKKDYAVMPILKPSADYDGKLLWPGHPASMVYSNDVVFAMTTACPEENREPLFKFIDSLYTNERSLRQTYGDGLVFNEDGTVAVTVPVEGMSLDDYTWTYAYGDKAVGYVSADYEPNIIQHEEMKEKYDIDMVYCDHIPNAVPMVILPDADNAELSVIKTDLDNIRKQYVSECVTGTKNVDETWDQYLADMKAAQAERYVEIYQQAFDKLA